MMSDDTADLRTQLSDAWRSLAQRLIDSGHPGPAVVETMFDAAVERFAAEHGSTSAANYLHLIADQIQVSAKEQADALIEG
jgi:hypothetical protein